MFNLAARGSWRASLTVQYRSSMRPWIGRANSDRTCTSTTVSRPPTTGPSPSAVVQVTPPLLGRGAVVDGGRDGYICNALHVLVRFAG